MSHGIVLNHHSLPFDCPQNADKGVLVFLKLLKFCKTAGLKILRVDEDQDRTLMRLELTKGYFVSHWFESAKNDPLLKDWCRLLKTLETKQPLFDTVHIEPACHILEVGLHGESQGKPVLLAAFFYDTFLASFSASAFWTNPFMEVWVFELGATPEQRDDQLLNLCTEVSLEIHGEELKQRRNLLLKDAKDLWLGREEFFPNLTLLANQIGTILQNWSARQDVLLKARDALSVLNSFCAKWKEGEYVEYRHEYLHDSGLAAEVSGESRSVRNDHKKKKERDFWLPDGREVYCENHIKLPHGFRMHFYPDGAERTIYIAYLGPHLTI